MATTVARNVAFLRRNLGHTQESFAMKLGIKRSLLGAYEEGRATPRFEVLDKISELAGKPISTLLNHELDPGGEAAPKQRGRPKGATGPRQPRTDVPLAPSTVSNTSYHYQPQTTAVSQLRESDDIPFYGPEHLRHRTGADLRTLTVTANPQGQALISLVRYADLRFYPSMIAQASSIAGLDAFTLPFLDDRQLYRAFEPVENAGFVVGRYLRNWLEIDGQRRYLVVTAAGISHGQLRSQLRQEAGGLELLPFPTGQPRSIGATELLEVWEEVYQLLPPERATPTAPAAPVDLSPLEQRLDRLEGLLKQVALR